MSPIVVRLRPLGHTWRLDTRVIGIEVGHQQGSEPSIEVGHQPANLRARAGTALDVPEWLRFPEALDLTERVVRAGVEHIGQLAAVTFTVADGVVLTNVGRLFASAYVGSRAGSWLVPEHSPAGSEHYHGLVLCPDLARVVARWQLSGGGIERCQKIDPIP